MMRRMILVGRRMILVGSRIILGRSRRANLSVRFTDKNGDRAEAGKIWENQIFTIKRGLHRPKCPQMCESICQGIRNI